MPVTFTRLSFSGKDLGNPQKDIKLTQLSGADITLEGPAAKLGTETGAEVYAFSKEGLQLSYRSSSRTDVAHDEAMKKLLETPWRALPKVVADPPPGTHWLGFTTAARWTTLRCISRRRP